MEDKVAKSEKNLVLQGEEVGKINTTAKKRRKMLAQRLFMDRLKKEMKMTKKGVSGASGQMPMALEKRPRKLS